MTPSCASVGERLLRFLRFSIAGATGFVVQIAVVALLANWAGMNYLAATAIAVEAAIVINFLWHERWTWRDRPAMPGRECAAVARSMR
jgi:putative flippase GtrA